MKELSKPTQADIAINSAQADIAKILSKLEADTGSVVEVLDIEDIEVTSYGSVRQEMMRSVRIQMKRLPGTRWQGVP